MTFGIDVAVGAALAMAWIAVVRRTGRAERAWIAVGLVVAAVVYPALGLTAHAPGELRVELVGVALFGLLAALGWAWSPWILALGWALHAPWDLLLPWIVDTGYVPHWYGAACLGFDLVVAAAVLAGVARAPRLAAGAGAGAP